MTPLQFEQRHAAHWAALEAALDALDRSRRRGGFPDGAKPEPTAAAGRIVEQYRLACEQLALVRERRYPLHLVQRLELLTQRAHQHIYRVQDFGLRSLGRTLVHDFPCATRALAGPLALATAAFGVGFVALLAWVLRDPGAALTVLDAHELIQFERMYSATGDEGIGHRDARSDWEMFGFYIRNNIGVAFQCLATGLLAVVGSLAMLVLNGVHGGAVAGWLVSRGLGETFWSFVVTHAAFEITAIVLAGAVGIRLGQAVLMPGRATRAQALQLAGRAVMPVVYGLTLMLLVAAGIEAFWSSARWVVPAVKYGIGAGCWALVLLFLWRGGRGGSASHSSGG